MILVVLLYFCHQQKPRIVSVSVAGIYLNTESAQYVDRTMSGQTTLFQFHVAMHRKYNPIEAKSYKGNTHFHRIIYLIYYFIIYLSEVPMNKRSTWVNW